MKTDFAKSDDLPFIGLVDEAMSDAEELLLRPVMFKFRNVMKTHAWSSVYQAVESGIGFGILPDFLVKPNSGLSLVPSCVSSPLPIWLVIHPDLKGNARVGAVIKELQGMYS